MMGRPADLREISFRLRKTVLEMCIRAGTGHLTSSLSCIDILVSLFHGGVLRFRPRNPGWEGRDRFILSKGQASPALYALLAGLGYFEEKELDRFAQKGGKFGVHLQKSVPGAEITSGSLGHGFGIAAGMALAARMDGRTHRVFTLLGDGELDEGSIWETALLAGHHRLDNLTAIVDRNGMCVTGFTEKIVALEPLEEKWRSFGWEARRVDGHSHRKIQAALRRSGTGRGRRPLVVIADTEKGRGIPCLVGRPLWHGLAPAGDMAERCRRELEEGRGRG
jgi:transketolase